MKNVNSMVSFGTPGICAVNPVVKRVKELGRSRFFFVICLLQTFVMAVVFLVGIVFRTGQVEDLEVTVLQSVIATIPFILFTVGIWMVRSACKSDLSPFVSTGGLQYLRVIFTIQLVVNYVVTGILTFVTLSFGEFNYTNSAQEYLDDVDGSGITQDLILLLIIVLLVGVCVVTHLVRASLCPLIENCQGILSDRSFPLATVVFFYIVFGVGVGAFLVCCTLNYFVALVIMLYAVLFLLGGIFMNRYRKAMEQLRAESTLCSQTVPMDNGSLKREQPKATHLVQGEKTALGVRGSTPCGGKTLVLTVKPKRKQSCETESPQQRFCAYCGNPLQNSQETPCSQNKICSK